MKLVVLLAICMAVGTLSAPVQKSRLRRSPGRFTDSLESEMLGQIEQNNNEDEDFETDGISTLLDEDGADFMSLTEDDDASLMSTANVGEGTDDTVNDFIGDRPVNGDEEYDEGMMAEEAEAAHSKAMTEDDLDDEQLTQLANGELTLGDYTNGENSDEYVDKLANGMIEEEDDRYHAEFINQYDNSENEDDSYLDELSAASTAQDSALNVNADDLTSLVSNAVVMAQDDGDDDDNDDSATMSDVDAAELQELNAADDEVLDDLADTDDDVADTDDDVVDTAANAESNAAAAASDDLDVDELSALADEEFEESAAAQTTDNDAAEVAVEKTRDSNEDDLDSDALLELQALAEQ